MTATAHPFRARIPHLHVLVVWGVAVLATPSVAGTIWNTADSGPGSLRQAVTEATPGALITFAPSLAGKTIILTSGQLVLDKNLSIDASGLSSPVTIDAGTAPTPQRVLCVTSPATVLLDSLIITGGRTADANPPFDGKYRRQVNPAFEPGDGGGIHNAGTLTVRRCTLRGNTTGRGGDYWLYGSPGGSGGGLYNSGTMTVEDCLITGNGTGTGGNGIGGWYDGVDCTNSSYCYWDLREKLIGRGGSGGPGAGLCNAGSLVLRGSTISGNATGAGGGGVDGPDETYYDGDIEHSSSIAGNFYLDDDGNFVDFDDYYDSKRRYQDGGDGGMGGPGGGIANEGHLELTQCSIEGNTTGSGGDGIEDGGAGGPGGGLSNEGDLEIARCSVKGNTTGSGGVGRDGLPGTGGHGAGLDHDKGSCLVEASAIINNSTAEGEKFGGSGSGVFVQEGAVTIRNATISGNLTGDGGFRGGSGAGVFHLAGDLLLEHATIAGNSCGEGGSYPGGVGGLYTQDGDLEVRNSVIAGNAAGSGNPDYERWQSKVDFEGDNQVGGDARLAPLGLHGGPTPTMPPLPGSPVIDDGVALPGNPSTDQRGFARPMGNGPDLGAVESGHPTGYLAWATTQLSSGSDVAYEADADGDGFSNALTYACGPDGAPAIATLPGGMAISFGYRQEAQVDTVLRIMRSTDLVHFTEILRLAGGDPVLADGCSLSGLPTRLTLLDASAPTGRAYYRIEVGQTSP